MLLRCRHILCKEHAQQWLGHQVESAKMDDSVLLPNQCFKPFHPLLAKNAAIQPLRILPTLTNHLQHAFSWRVSKSGDPPIPQNSMGFYCYQATNRWIGRTKILRHNLLHPVAVRKCFTFFWFILGCWCLLLLHLKTAFFTQTT